MAMSGCQLRRNLMLRNKVWVFVSLVFAWPAVGHADVVTDWNETIRHVIKSDGHHMANHANPGWSTRSMAMMNGAIYDAFQSVDRTYAPFLYKPQTNDASLEAAVHKAARDILMDCYTHQDEQ